LVDFLNHDSVPYMTDTSMMEPLSAQRPRLEERTSVGQHRPLLADTSPDNTKTKEIRREGHDRSFTARAMPSAPIAQVLNDESNIFGAAQSVPTTFTSSTTAPFSGRLADLLLNSPDHLRPRWDQELQYTQPEATGCSPSVIKLPRLPQPPKRTAKRPRIPPLLQGLHQPPPLPPEGRLFPPITSEKNAFVGERGYETLFEESRNREVDDHAFLDGSATDLFRITQHEEVTLAPQPAAQLAPSNGAVAVPETDVTPDKATDTQDQTNSRRGKKRNKWSEQETKDLLVGVSRFGIGNWKRILQNPDFTFNNRTAVDLKDRFRVCCPGEGSKQRQSKKSTTKQSDETSSELPPETAHNSQTSTPSIQENLSTETAPAPKTTKQQRKATQSKAVLDLAELGIREPFSKNARRSRRVFSERDDVNLLRGYEKYGPVWHSIRDDMELDFGTRHPTDLRDRFRIRYPEKYAKAGYKLKPKEERMIEKQIQGQLALVDHPPSTVQASQRGAPTNASQPSPGIETHSSHTFLTNLPPASTSNTTLKPFSQTYLSDSLPFSFLDDIPADEDESSITLYVTSMYELHVRHTLTSYTNVKE
jgi:hypothetical protein